MERTAGERLSSLLDQLIDHTFAASPVEATAAGFHKYDGELGDCSPAALAGHLTALRHARCNAHHLRELTSLVEQGQIWAREMIDFLLEGNRPWKRPGPTLTALSRKSWHAWQSGALRCSPTAGRRALSRLFPVPPDGGADPPQRGPRTCSTGWSDTRCSLSYTTFGCPSTTTWQSGPAPGSVQQKIAGTLRSLAGAQAFCRIRGYISTVRKQGLAVLAALEAGFRGQPFLLIRAR